MTRSRVISAPPAAVEGDSAPPTPARPVWRARSPVAICAPSSGDVRELWQQSTSSMVSSSSTRSRLSMRSGACRRYGGSLCCASDRTTRLTRRGGGVEGAASARTRLEPWMAADLRDGDALHRVDDEHAGDQVARELREVRRQRVHAALDLFEQIRNRLVVERKRAAQQRVQDDAAGPHVDLGAGVQRAEITSGAA